MAREKKTCSIESIKARFNTILASPVNEHIDLGYKRAIASQLEWALHGANAYKGYRYLDNQNCEFGTLGYWEREYY